MDGIDILTAKIQRNHPSWNWDMCEADATSLVESGIEYNAGSNQGWA